MRLKVLVGRATLNIVVSIASYLSSFVLLGEAYLSDAIYELDNSLRVMLRATLFGMQDQP